MTTFLKKKNNAKTFLSDSISASVLTIEVNDASQLPNTNDFMITIWNSTTFPDPSDDSSMEIVKVTNISGNILTIVRGQENTSAHSHAMGDTVANLLTAGQIKEIEDAINDSNEFIELSDAPSTYIGQSLKGLRVKFDESSLEFYTVAGDSDEFVKVSANDTTAGYLNGKLVAGSNISLVENNDGANETLTISANLEEVLSHSDLSDMPDSGGTNTDHDARYYTESEIDALIANYVPYSGATGNVALGANNITANNLNIANWDTAYTHTTLTNNPHNVDETDILPSQATHSGKYLTTNGTVSSWATIDLSAYFHKTNDDTDDIIDTATNRFVTDTQIGNWNTAYGWGDHSAEGYLKNIVEDTTPQLGGNLDGQSYNITTTGTGTFGKGIFDVTDSEAVLVRKDGDSGDTFVIDTTNTRLGFNATPSHLYSVAVYAPQSTDPFERTGGGFFMRAGKGYSTSTNMGGTGGKFELEGGAGGTANWGLMIKTGGDGGILKLRGGVGGNAGGTGNLRGGDGGNLQLVGGNKGYGATTDGDGGDVEIVSGLGVTHGEIKLIIGDFAGTTILTGLSDGSGIQQDDNIKHYFGTGEDASIYYDSASGLTINPKEVGSSSLNIQGQLLMYDKIMFTQTDGNEYIDSLADGYMDYGATTAHRFNNNITLLLDNKHLYLGAGQDIDIYHDGTDSFIKTDATQATDLIVNCGTDKTLELGETVWNDYILPIIGTKPGATAPTFTTFVGNTKQYTFSVNDEVHGTNEILHEYKEGTDIKVHVHWATNGVDGTDRTVKWELEYSIQNSSLGVDSAFPATTTISGETTIPANSDDKAHSITAIGTISGTNRKVGDIVVWRFRRIASSGTEPSNDSYALQIGFHHEINTIGSRQEWVK